MKRNIIESSYKAFAPIANALDTADLPRNMVGGAKDLKKKTSENFPEIL